MNFGCLRAAAACRASTLLNCTTSMRRIGTVRASKICSTRASFFTSVPSGMPCRLGTDLTSMTSLALRNAASMRNRIGVPPSASQTFKFIVLPLPRSCIRSVRLVSLARMILPACLPSLGTSRSRSQTRLRNFRLSGSLPSSIGANTAALAFTATIGSSNPFCTHMSSRASQTWLFVGVLSVQSDTWRSTPRQLLFWKSVGLMLSARRS